MTISIDLQQLNLHANRLKWGWAYKYFEPPNYPTAFMVGRSIDSGFIQKR